MIQKGIKQAESDIASMSLYTAQLLAMRMLTQPVAPFNVGYRTRVAAETAKVTKN